MIYVCPEWKDRAVTKPCTIEDDGHECDCGMNKLPEFKADSAKPAPQGE